MDDLVAIIGAGIGGIATAVKLQQAGIDRFTVFERSDGPGGTWRDNHYPGASCDIPSHLYSFSFRLKHDWTRTHAPSGEILGYIEAVTDELGIRSHCRFGTSVVSATWDEGDGLWWLETDGGERLSYRFVVSALGLLNVPKMLDVPGIDDFEGPVFHTARWRDDVDLAGKRVAVVGTGSTAAQVVPGIAEEVEHLTVFQREPGWVLPRGDRAFTASELRRFRRNPLAKRVERFKTYVRGEMISTYLNPRSKMSAKITGISLSFLESAVEDPVTRAALTPSYPYGCKRPIVSDDYYPTFNRPNVELVPAAVREVTPTGVVAEDGTKRDVDVLVMATGFQPTRFLCTIDVVGRGGRRLHDVWDEAGGAEALLGASVAGFPNFFMIYGPNSNSSTTSLVFILECQAAHAAAVIRRALRGAPAAVEVRTRIMDRYNRWLHAKMGRTAWLSGCTNYYRAPSGKLVTNWPHTATLYWLMTKASARLPLVYRRVPAAR